MTINVRNPSLFISLKPSEFIAGNIKAISLFVRQFRSNAAHMMGILSECKFDLFIIHVDLFSLYRFLYPPTGMSL